MLEINNANISGITFDITMTGLSVNGILYLGSKELVYGQIMKAIIAGVITVGPQNNVVSYATSNTSTLIPAMIVKGMKVDPYFMEREVVESQNNILFYRKASKLAAFYNICDTDDVGKDSPELWERIEKAIALIPDVSSLKPEFSSHFGKPEDVTVLATYGDFIVSESGGASLYRDRVISPKLKKGYLMISSPLHELDEDVKDMAQELITIVGGQDKFVNLNLTKPGRVILEPATNETLNELLLAIGYKKSE